MDSDKLDELRRAIRAEDDGSASVAASPRMLDIRTLNQGWLALPYEALRRVEYDPREKTPLRIYFSSHILELEGRNLQALYRTVVSKRLDQLREIGERHDVGGPDDAVVHSLRILEKPQTERERRGRGKPNQPGLWGRGRGAEER